MIAGDHPDTAISVARDLGIAGADETVITGAKLDDIDDEGLAHRVERARVYARVTAEHKLRIIKAWRAHEHIVAMTGDGVNDAPALRAADNDAIDASAGTWVPMPPDLKHSIRANSPVTMPLLLLK
jgi:Ca2+-transporting ATPase